MRIAISTDGGFVSAHFGRCPGFTLAEIEDNRVIKKELLENPGHQPGFLPQFLNEKGVECIIAGGMGQRARMLFNQHNIQTIMGITGTIDTVLSQLCDGTLEGGESLCQPGKGKGYGVDKTECDHGNHNH
jgi:predicted Fe-Mo cluster-binding NifX family protein